MTAAVEQVYVELVPLTLVDEGDAVVVGDPRAGQFISVPAVGGVVIRALQRGASVAEAGAEASAYAGEHVDVAGFVDGLAELGFVAGTGANAQRTAPVQQRRWVGAVAPGLARPLFSRVAWCGYTAAALFVIGVFIFVPALRPRPHDVFVLSDYGLSVLLLAPFTTALTCLHECWHWIAARALGLSVRFGVDRRWYFLVFETDLSQLWTVPRRQRYGPQLAGIAVDSTVAALLVGVRWLVPVPGLVARVAAALTYLLVMQVLWQAMVFLRTDLYGVLVTATGTRNLWTTNQLLIRRMRGRLSPTGWVELEAADPRDLAVARWFRWVYLGGRLILAAYILVFVVPVVLATTRWAIDGFSSGVSHSRFWITLGSSIPIFAPLLAAGTIWLIQLRRARGSAEPR